MDEYYYLDANQQQKGPVPPSDFIRTGITKHTLLWKKGMAGWQAAGNIPELADYFQPAVPPPPPSFGCGSATDTSSRQPSMRKPENFLIGSILTTVFCCLPLGIIAIIFSVKVDGLWRNGDYEGAVRAAQKAKFWCILSAGLSVAGFIVGMLLFYGFYW